MGQTANSRFVRAESVHPSISDIMLQRRERRNGPIAAVSKSASSTAYSILCLATVKVAARSPICCQSRFAIGPCGRSRRRAAVSSSRPPWRCLPAMERRRPSRSSCSIVLVENDDLISDGVNLAARIQQAADPDAVDVSATLFEQIRRNSPFAFDDRGEQSFRDIVQPVRIYRLRGEITRHVYQIAPTQPTPMQAKRPFSLAVMPIEVASGGHQESPVRCGAHYCGCSSGAPGPRLGLLAGGNHEFPKPAPDEQLSTNHS